MNSEGNIVEFLKNLFMSRWFFYITFTNSDGVGMDGYRIVRASSVMSALSKVSNEIESKGCTELMFIRFNKL